MEVLRTESFKSEIEENLLNHVSNSNVGAMCHGHTNEQIQSLDISHRQGVTRHS